MPCRCLYEQNWLWAVTMVYSIAIQHYDEFRSQPLIKWSKNDPQIPLISIGKRSFITHTVLCVHSQNFPRPAGSFSIVNTNKNGPRNRFLRTQKWSIFGAGWWTHLKWSFSIVNTNKISYPSGSKKVILRLHCAQIQINENSTYAHCVYTQNQFFFIV